MHDCQELKMPLQVKLLLIALHDMDQSQSVRSITWKWENLGKSPAQLNIILNN